MEAWEREQRDDTLRLMEQGHARIEALLRDEISTLRDQLQSCFQEVASLSARLDMAEAHRRHSNRLSRILVRAPQYRPGRAKQNAARLPALREQRRALEKSPLFDAEWYARVYALDQKSSEAALHYLRVGAFEGRDPSAGFSSMQYYLANEDVARAGWPALVHYEMVGRQEGRTLSLWDDGELPAHMSDDIRQSDS